MISSAVTVKTALIVGFAIVLALDTNKIHREMCIELSYILSRARCSHQPGDCQGFSSTLIVGFAIALALDINEICLEMCIELSYSLSRAR